MLVSQTVSVGPSNYTSGYVTQQRGQRGLEEILVPPVHSSVTHRSSTSVPPWKNRINHMWWSHTMEHQTELAKKGCSDIC